ncbi:MULTISPECIES: hypothetical protein [unclassified Streptomyces]|uniref:hypothetical protein n=1 Tax=unclassified Streptomyces TaxID=2593676 RepID=UPI001876B970|nr:MULTISPECIES: hypothetical protein [unclassified Streptomyces]
MVSALLRESSGVWFGLGDAELSVTSVMALVEGREAAARVRAEELRVEAERVLAELAKAEAVLERRVIATAELAETLAGRDAMLEEGAASVDEVATAVVADTTKAPVAGSVVPRWHAGATVLTLSADYRRIVELVEAEPGTGEGISAKELAGRLGLAAVPAKTEGVRSKARRLAERGWLAALPSGRFTPREPTATARAGAGMPSGRGGGS